MKSFYAAALLLFYITGSVANTNDLLNHLGNQGLRQKALIANQDLETAKADSLLGQVKYRTAIDTILQSAKNVKPNEQQGQGVNGAVLFVSFSMPESLLFALSDEAASFEIPLVINGLVDGDFKKTIKTFTRLHEKAKKEHLNFKGVSIDPLWFEQFHISSVPALVVSSRPANCEPQSLCPSQPYDVVYGNASVKKSLELIAEKGESASHLARLILENGHA